MEIKHAITLDTQGLKASAKEATDILHGIGKSAEQEGDRMDAAFKKVGAAVAGFFTVQQATNFVKSMVSVRGEIESLEISFRTLVGSKDKADALFASIREFAVTTPLQLGDLAKSAQTLLGYNIEAEKIMPTLKMIGDISMGDAGKMQALTNAFAQMSSTGKLVGQDLMQMINAGFNPLAEISQKTGKSISQLEDEMSKGKISVKMVEDAFKSATSEGGKFYNMLEQQSHGINGAISNLKGAWDDMLNTIGEKMQGTVLSAVDAVTSLVQNFEKVGKVIADIAITFGVYKAAVIAVNIAKTIAIEKSKGYTIAQQAELRATVALEKAQKALNRTMLSNPYVLAAAALTALAVGLYRVATNTTKTEEAARGLADAFSQTEANAAKERKEIDALFEALRKAEKKTKEYDAAKDAIISKYGQYLTKLGDEKRALDDIEAAYKAVTEAAEQSWRMRGFDEYMANLSSSYTEELGDLKEKLKKQFGKVFGEELGAEYFAEASQMINNGDIAGLKKKLFGGGRGTWSNDMVDGKGIAKENLRQTFGKLERAQANYEKGKQAAETRYGISEESLLQDRADKAVEEEKKRKEKEEADEKARKQAEAAQYAKEHKAEIERLAREKHQRQQKIEQYGKDVAKAMTDAEFEIEQASINGMQEGSDKQLKQIDLNYRMAIEQNERRADEWLEALRDKKEEEWELANQGYSQNVHFDRSSVTADMLSDDEKEKLKAYEQMAAKQRQTSEKALYDAMLRQYADYEQQKLLLQQEYMEKYQNMFIQEGENQGQMLPGLTEENIALLDRELEDKLKALNTTIVSDTEAHSELLKALFENATSQTADAIATNIELAEELFAIINGGENTLVGADGKLMFTDAQIAAMRQDGEFIKKMLQSIIDKKEELSGRKGAMGQFVDSIKELMDAFGKSGSAKMEGISKAMQKMLSSAGTLNSAVGDLAGKWREIGELTKNDTLKGVAGTVEGISGTLSDTMSGISAGLAIGGPVGGAIMGAISLVTSLFKTSAEHQAELEAKEKELTEERESAQAAYNLLLIEQNELLKEATNIFKEDALKAAMGYAQQLAAATDLYNSSMSALYGANVRSGSHQEGWWIFGSQVDDYSGILSMYPQLIDESGRLNNELLRTLLDTITFEDEATKAALMRLLQYSEAVEEARDNLRSYLSDTFGSLADGLMDSITKSLEDGSDALKSFADKVSAVLRDMGEQLAYSLYFAKFFNNLQEQLEGIFEDTSLSPEEIMNQSTELLMGFFDNIGDQIDGAQGFLQQWQDMMEERGFNMFDRQMEQSTGIAASQESVDKLDGRMTVVQGHTYMMNENLKIVTNNVGVILSSVRVIEANTSHISDTLDEVRATVSRSGAMIDNIDTRGVKIRN